MNVQENSISARKASTLSIKLQNYKAKSFLQGIKNRYSKMSKQEALRVQRCIANCRKPIVVNIFKTTEAERVALNNWKKCVKACSQKRDEFKAVIIQATDQSGQLLAESPILAEEIILDDQTPLDEPTLIDQIDQKEVVTNTDIESPSKTYNLFSGKNIIIFGLVLVGFYFLGKKTGKLN